MKEPREEVQFAAHLAREISARKANAYQVAILAEELIRLSRNHNHIQCKLCNGLIRLLRNIDSRLEPCNTRKEVLEGFEFHILDINGNRVGVVTVEE